MALRVRLLLTLVLLTCMAPASLYAHALLLRSTPAAHATLTHPTPFELQFNSRVDGARSRITLTTRKDAAHFIPLVPVAQPAPQILTTAPVAALPAGDYVLHWIALAGDGHISRGEIPFSVR